jgi:hypothetical protein
MSILARTIASRFADGERRVGGIRREQCLECITTLRERQ